MLTSNVAVGDSENGMVTGDVYDVPPRITNGPEEVIQSADKQYICRGLLPDLPAFVCVFVCERASKQASKRDCVRV